MASTPDTTIVDTGAAALAAQVKPVTIGSWAHRGRITAIDHAGPHHAARYRLDDVLDCLPDHGAARRTELQHTLAAALAEQHDDDLIRDHLGTRTDRADNPTPRRR